MTLNGGPTYSKQEAVAKGKGALAINAAAYANVTVYQYVTYDGGSVMTREISDPSVCPYPGLESFQTSAAMYFAGRSEGIAALEAALREHDITGVIAASGAGKSSLVHAGLIPALAAREEESWDVFAFKPGHDPLNGLARSISGALASKSTLDDLLNEIRRNVSSLRATPGRLSEYVEEIVQRRAGIISGKRHNVLIFIDQWEELYAEENDEDRDILVRELIEVAKRGLAKVLMTMRIDFMGEMLQQSTDFFRELKPGINYIEPMNETELRSAIEAPAQVVGLRVPEILTLRLIADLQNGRDHGSLTYLQFVLRQLWKRRHKSTNSLTIEAYDAMKGIKGAIGTHADEVFRKLSKEEQGQAQRVLPRLANVSEQGLITSRRLPFSDFGDSARKLLRKLAEPERRLIVLTSATKDAAEPEIIAEVAHEALFSGWKALAGWISDRSDFFRVRNKLEADARHWDKNNRSPELLLPSGKPLTDACAFAAIAEKEEISSTLGEFIAESRSRDKSAGKRRFVLTVASTLIVTIFAGYAVSQRNRIAERDAWQQAIWASQQIDSGVVEKGLASGIEASIALQNSPYKEQAEQILRKGIARAAQETHFSIPEQIYPFEWNEQLYFQNTQNGELYAFDGDGAPSVIYNMSGYLFAGMEVNSLGYVMLTQRAGDIVVWSLSSNREVTEVCSVPTWNDDRTFLMGRPRLLGAEISSNGIVAIVSELDQQPDTGARVVDITAQCKYIDVIGDFGSGFLSVNAAKEVRLQNAIGCVDAPCGSFGSATVVERELGSDERLDTRAFSVFTWEEQRSDEMERNSALLQVDANNNVLSVSITRSNSTVWSDTRRMAGRVTYVVANSTSKVFALLSPEAAFEYAGGEMRQQSLVVVDFGGMSPWLSSLPDSVNSQLFQRVCLRMIDTGLDPSLPLDTSEEPPLRFTSRAVQRPVGFEDIVADFAGFSVGGMPQFRFSANGSEYLFSVPGTISDGSPCFQFSRDFDYFNLVIDGTQGTVYSSSGDIFDVVFEVNFLSFLPFTDSMTGLVVRNGRSVGIWDIRGLQDEQREEPTWVFSSPIGFVQEAYFDRDREVLLTIESEEPGWQVSRLYDLSGESFVTPVFDLAGAKHIGLHIAYDGSVLLSSGTDLLGQFNYPTGDQLRAIATNILYGRCTSSVLKNSLCRDVVLPGG